MNKYNPAIVVCTFNRPACLTRLLGMLQQGIYPNQVHLVISIDGGGDAQTVALSEKFSWLHGEKSIIIHESNLGLRQHVLLCGDLTERYGSIILLEDDLGVSKYFYKYACEALNLFDGRDDIGGISLYKHLLNVNCKERFDPVDNGNNYFLMQFAQSWGEAWSDKQWSSFRQWYNKNINIDFNEIDIPNYVRRWPKSSWMKYFISYLVQKNIYFVYPNRSLSTNFCDIGTNSKKNRNIYRVPLSETELVLKSNKEEIKYDVFFEIDLESLNNFIPEGSKLPDNTIIDTYGIKNIVSSNKDKYILTIRPTKKAEKKWAKLLKPKYDNVVHEIQGSGLSLCKVDYIPTKHLDPVIYIDIDYDSPEWSFKSTIKYLVKRIIK